MTTVINTPGGQSDDSGLGFILGVIVAIVLVALFFVYALPALRQKDQPTTNVITIPIPGTGSTDNSGTGTE